MGTSKYVGTKTEKNLQAAFAGESQARMDISSLEQRLLRYARPVIIPRAILKYMRRIINQSESCSRAAVNLFLCSLLSTAAL